MPLTAELPAAVRYLVPGLVGGLVSFAFSRVMIEPLISAAVDYEGEREHAEAELGGEAHAHGHELFSRAVQANVGSAVGIIAVAIAMGVLFVVAYQVVRTALERRGHAPDDTALALTLAAGMFAAIVLVPSLKYPANPPTVGLEETMGVRSSSFLTMTVTSVVCACAAVAIGVMLARQWGGWRATGFAAGGYLAVMLVTMALLPSFHEVPGPVEGQDGLVLGGFPPEVLADFRLYTLVNQALMWLGIGVAWAGVMALAASRRRQAVLVAMSN